MSDKRVGESLGLGTSKVSRKRKATGVPPVGRPPRPVEWSDEMVGFLGLVPDREVAERYGLDKNTVAT